MSGSEDTLFIAYKNVNNMYQVGPILPERGDQLLSYTTFMSSLGSNSRITKIYFNYPSTNGPIIYHIQKYIDETSGNPGNFCVYVNESGVQSILSKNKAALEKHARDQNRMISQGGNRKKHSRNRKTKKSKRSKRAHTTKRK